MISITPLQVFACDDLLILLWSRNEKLVGKYDVLLDGQPLPRPMLRVECAEDSTYLIAAFVEGISSKRNFSLRIQDAEAIPLAETQCKRVSAFTKKQVSSWTQETRNRIQGALLVQAPKIFPLLSVSTQSRLALLFAQPAVRVIAGPEGWIYLRLRGMATDEPGLMNARIRSAEDKAPDHDESVVTIQTPPPSGGRLGGGGDSKLQQYQDPPSPQPPPAGRGSERLQSVRVLLDGEFLHFFGRTWPQSWKQDRVWLLEADEVLRIPFVFSCPKSSERIASPQDWFAAVLADYSGFPATMRGFAALIPELPGTKPVPSSLRGRIEGIREGWLLGWAYDEARPETALSLRIMVDGSEREAITANLPSPSPSQPTIPNCGFAWKLDLEQWSTSEQHEIRIVSTDSSEDLRGSPLQWGDGWFDGEFELDRKGRLCGWVKERATSQQTLRLSVLVDGVVLREIFPLPEDLENGANRDPHCSFQEAMPNWLFDTHPHSVEIEAINPAGQRGRLEKILTVRAEYRGHIDIATSERVFGWIINTIAPERPVKLDVFLNGKLHDSGVAHYQRPDVVRELILSRCGFDFSLNPPNKNAGSSTVELRIAGTQTRVLEPAFLSTPYEIALRSLITLAQTLNSQSVFHLAGGIEYTEDVGSWARTQIIAQLLNELRREKTIPRQITISPTWTFWLPHRAEKESIVDIIVPVHQGREDTLECIRSVLAAPCQTSTELIVINDASPDPELQEDLRRLSREHGFMLLENRTNLGFVASVNHCMGLHPGRDVVLLNSDTRVTGDWLDRLHSAACSAANIGTVTPFSNNATICSFPEFCRDNPCPDEASARELDALFAASHRGCLVDLPTAVGFCMYIKRSVLEETGLFDEGRWGKGYGEENDFCLRAANLGWRHVAACDVFVAHKGGVSFGEEKESLMERNLGKLNSLYPDYQATVERFMAQDPLARFRNRIQVELLARQTGVSFLFVIHSLGGGTQVAADHLAERLTAEGKSVLELSSISQRHWCLRCHGQPYSLYYRFPADWESLVEDLRTLGVFHIHYHQTMHFPRQIWELPEKLGVRYDFTLHDYLPICPRINLIDESGAYCGDSQFSPQSCTRCVRMNGMDHDLDEKYAEFGGDVAHWRAIYQRLLANARRVFVPSGDTEARIRKHFELPGLSYQPHPEPRRTVTMDQTRKRRFEVAVIGAIGESKGYETLLECVCSAEKEGLPLHFSIIGYTQDNSRLLAYGNVSITGAYRPEEVAGLIRRSGAGVALFLSPWPETYCYTLSEAWSGGLYPVALDIGAIAERIREVGYGEVIPLDSAAKQINQVLMRVFEQEPRGPRAITLGSGMENLFRDYYQLEGESGLRDSSSETAGPAGY